LFFYFSAAKLGFFKTISTAVATSLYRAQQFEAKHENAHPVTPQGVMYRGNQTV